jgi:tetratricopeptide (TPR) repeat protein
MVPRRSISRRFARGDLVGRGGAGRVYRAVDLATGKPVALKLLTLDDPRSQERFEQEARALADLEHPHIVGYVDHGVTEEGEPYLAMEWLEGESLAHRLARGPLTVGESVELGRAVAEALAATHGRGLVHRDIKPSNLFLAQGEIGGVRVLDFGLVRIIGTSQVVTQTGALMGTPGYMAPEQARNDRDAVDARADVFSLGAVLFECLTGRRAFEGLHAMAVLAQLLLAEVPRVREIQPAVPAALDDLVARMLAKDPAERPADGAEVARELAAVGREVSKSSLPPAAARAITGMERRLMSVVAIRRDPSGDPAGDLARVRELSAERGAGVFELAGGAVLVTLSEQGGATDQAAVAARGALRLRAALPGASMALAMGRGEATGRLPIGPVVERAAELLEAGTEHAAVRIDEVTRALLDDRFEVREAGAGLSLAGEREVSEGARTLLGRPTPYVGRERELRMLAELLQSTFEGERPAQAAIVTAPPGMGKTRLRHELVKALRAAAPDVLVGIGRADAMGAGAPFAVASAALRHAMGIGADEPPAQARAVGPDGAANGPKPRRDARASLIERVAAVVPEPERGRVAAFLGELIGLPFPDDDDPALQTARRNGARMAEEIARAFVDFLRGACAARPVLLVIEDMHWGDAASVRLLDLALRDLADERFAVLALGRPEMHDLFPDLWGKRDVQAVRLGPLPRRAAEELVTRALGDALSAEERARVVEQAGGNAFYLEELVRALAEGRKDSLPETVLGMVEARIEALPPEARRLLRAASVFGETFTKGGALALLAEEERLDASLRWLPWLADRELIVRRGTTAGGDEEHAFRHALVREASYAMLTADDLVLGHRLAGEWLRASGEAGAASAAIIGEHFFRGEEWDAAAEAFDQAGDAAAHLHENAEARSHYLRSLSALDKLDPGAERLRRRVDTVIKKVAVSYADDPAPNLALLAEAEAIALALPEAAEPPRDDYRRVARVHYWLGRTHWYKNAYPEAIGYYQRTIAAAQKLGDRELEAQPSGTIGRVFTAQGQFGKAIVFLERSLSPLSQSGQWVDWVVNAGNRGIAMAAAGHAELAFSEGEKVLAKAREIKSLTSESVALVNVGNIHMLLGKPARAAELFRTSAEVAERAGDRVYAYLAHGFCTWAETRQGHHDAAAESLAKARAIVAEMGRRLFYADWFDAFAVEAAQRAGRFEEAIAEAARVAPGLRASSNVFAEGLVQRAWALALAARAPAGAPLDEALDRLAESLHLFELGEIRVEIARTRLALALVHRRRGDEAKAAPEIEAARAFLTSIGAAGEIDAALTPLESGSTLLAR